MKEKWYKHEPETVMENDKCKILGDFKVQTDHEIFEGKTRCHCGTEG